MAVRRALAVGALLVGGGVGVPAVGGEPAGDSLDARVDRYLTALSESGLFAGTVRIEKGGKALVDRAYGLADRAAKAANDVDTAFKLMSVTKAMTAVAVMRLAQEGRLDLEVPVHKVLPQWPEGWGDVVVRHLLEHTSGIANLELPWTIEATKDRERGLGTWRRLAPSLAGKHLDTPAGARHAYSNFNFVLLGAIVEKVAGKPYPEAMRALVLDPAGMKRTSFDDGARAPGLAVGYFRGRDGVPEASTQDMSMIRGAGDAISTTGDLCRLDRALHGDTLLSAESKRSMTTPPPGETYALGWQVAPVHGHACARHSGGANGYVADFLRFPEDDACVAVCSNLAYAPILRIADDLAGLLFDRLVETPRRVAPADLDAYVGAYAESAGATVVVRRSGPALVAFSVTSDAPRCGGLLLVPLGDHRFLRQQWPTGLRFEPPEKGRSPALTIGGGGARETRFDRRDPPPWSGAAGTYRDEATRRPLRLTEAKGRLRLEAADAARDLDVVPVTSRLALVLYSEDFATLLELEGDGEKSAALRWTRNDGQVVRARRVP